MNYGFIYETTNLINGKKYIGSHKRSQDLKDPDDSWYLGSGKLLWRAFEKYGVNNFRRRILVECYSQEELESEETRILIETDAANDPNYYNIMPSYFGGTTSQNNPRNGTHHSEETKKKIGEHSGAARLGVPLSEEHRASISKSLNSEENKKRQSKLISGRIKINNGEIEKLIPPEELSLYESQGFKKGRLPKVVDSISRGNTGIKRSRNENQARALSESMKGRIAVSRGDETRKIHLDELDSYLSEGWIQGMSDSFKRMRSDSVKGKVHVYRGDDQKFVNPEDAEILINEGWSYGLPESQCEKIKVNHRYNK